MNSRTRFHRAANGQSVDRTPVWFMRQAGRIFPEYREIREEVDFLTLCKDPELNAKVTCMPVERLGVDAAIIFADILLILNCLGKGFRFVPDKGPTIDDPVRTPEDVRDLDLIDPDNELGYVFDAIEESRNRLPHDVPLIGFAGAPFTVASYLIEGGKSRQYHRTKNLMHEHPSAWNQLMELISDATVRYLRSMIDSGAEVIQLFDSWVGSLTPKSFGDFVLPHVREIFDSLDNPEISTIYFGTQTAGLLDQFSDVNSDVVGIDWRINLERANKLIDADRSLQGNLDPAMLLVPIDKILEDIDRIIHQAKNLPGHIFNLGHGVLPDTKPSNIKKLVDYVHEQTER